MKLLRHLLFWAPLIACLSCFVPLAPAQPSAPSAASSADATAAPKMARPEGPDSREIPLPEIGQSLPRLPSAQELAPQSAIPDPAKRVDGTHVDNPSDWPPRREEIKQTLEYYAVGRMPPPPGNVRAVELIRDTVFDGKVTYRLLKLSFGPPQSPLSLHVGLFTPVGEGRHPVIIRPGESPPGAPVLHRLPPGPGQGRGVNALLAVGPAKDTASAKPHTATAQPRTAEAIAAELSSAFVRGYAYALFNHNECGDDTTLRNEDGSWAFRNTGFFRVYPEYDWGLLGGWAWGVSRTLDYLETDPQIDCSRSVATGLSRLGKAVMIAGAFDERIALTVPVATGGGGVGLHRLSGGEFGGEGLADMVRKYPNWFSPHLRPFWGRVERLPFDQHWFIALVAPRGFLSLEGSRDPICNPAAINASLKGALPVYQLLHAEERLGGYYLDRGHAFTNEDWNVLLDFADRQFFGRQNGRQFAAFRR